MEGHAIRSDGRDQRGKVVRSSLVTDREIQPSAGSGLTRKDGRKPPSSSHREVVEIDDLFGGVAPKMVDGVDAFAIHWSPCGVRGDESSNPPIPVIEQLVKKVSVALRTLVPVTNPERVKFASSETVAEEPPAARWYVPAPIAFPWGSGFSVFQKAVHVSPVAGPAPPVAAHIAENTTFPDEFVIVILTSDEFFRDASTQTLSPTAALGET